MQNVETFGFQGGAEVVGQVLQHLAKEGLAAALQEPKPEPDIKIASATTKADKAALTAAVRAQALTVADKAALIAAVRAADSTAVLAALAATGLQAALAAERAARSLPAA